MAGGSLFTPQSQAGVMSFYDAPTNGPRLNPKMILAAVIVFTIIVLAVDHVIFAG